MEKLFRDPYDGNREEMKYKEKIEGNDSMMLITEEKVAEKVPMLTKVAGVDNIPNELLRYGGDTLVNIVTQLYN